MDPAQLPDYSNYSIQDFVLDDSFRQWVFHPTEPLMTFWHGFMLRYPEQQATIEEASSILLHLRIRQDDLSTASRERIRLVLEAAYDNQFLTATQPGLAQPDVARPGLARPDVARPFVQRWFGSSRVGWQLAASLTGLLLLAGSFAWTWQHHWRKQEIQTNYGELRTVTLPDGSTVQLNGNSTLTYPNNWTDQSDREVWLEGEAFFKVTKKQTALGQLKFVTHTPNLDISVLGTQFNVNTRRGNTEVMLTEGKVKLTRPDGQQARVIMMKPGDLATAQAGIEQVDVRTTQPEVPTAWTRQQFAFDNTPLRDIAQELADTWGVTLIFQDKALADRRFTGNLSSQDLETLITTLTATFGLQADRNDREIILRRQPAPGR